MYSIIYTRMDSADILPEIMIDDSADSYVETDEESEEEPEPPPKSRPPASEIFGGQPTIQVEVESEEEEAAAEEEEPQRSSLSPSPSGRPAGSRRNTWPAYG